MGLEPRSGPETRENRVPGQWSSSPLSSVVVSRVTVAPRVFVSRVSVCLCGFGFFGHKNLTARDTRKYYPRGRRDEAAFPSKTIWWLPRPLGGTGGGAGSGCRLSRHPVGTSSPRPVCTESVAVGVASRFLLRNTSLADTSHPAEAVLFPFFLPRRWVLSHPIWVVTCHMSVKVHDFKWCPQTALVRTIHNDVRISDLECEASPFRRKRCHGL